MAVVKFAPRPVVDRAVTRLMFALCGESAWVGRVPDGWGGRDSIPPDAWGSASRKSRPDKRFRGYGMTTKAQRKANNQMEFAETPSHLMRRCQQFYSELYARESGARDLTKQQFTVLCALEHRDGSSQTALVDLTGIDRSTLAEMVRRMLEKGLLSRERTEEDQRANAVAISASGRKALRGARTASERAEKMLLDALPPADRPKFVKLLAQVAVAAESYEGNGHAAPRGKVRRRRA